MSTSQEFVNELVQMDFALEAKKQVVEDWGGRCPRKSPFLSIGKGYCKQLAPVAS